ISLCFRGNIARDLETETLRRVLRGLFYSGERDAAALSQEAQAAAAIAKAVAALGTEAPADRFDDASSTQSMRARAPSSRPTENRRAATSRPVEEPGGG